MFMLFIQRPHKSANRVCCLRDLCYYIYSLPRSAHLRCTWLSLRPGLGSLQSTKHSRSCGFSTAQVSNGARPVARMSKWPEGPSSWHTWMDSHTSRGYTSALILTCSRLAYYKLAQSALRWKCSGERHAGDFGDACVEDLSLQTGS